MKRSDEKTVVGRSAANAVDAVFDECAEQVSKDYCAKEAEDGPAK